MGVTIPKQLSWSLLKLLQPRVLNWVLVVVISVSLFYLITFLINQQAMYKQDVLELTGLKKYLVPSDSKIEIQKHFVHSQKDYQELAESLFFQEPNFVVENDPRNKQTKPNPTDLNPYRLLKVMGLVGGKQAIIQDPTTKSTLYVREGDSVKEGTVISIQAGKVIIKVGEEKVELNF